MMMLVPASSRPCGRRSSGGRIWGAVLGTRWTSGAALTSEQRQAWFGIGAAAAYRVPEDVHDQILELGRLRYAPAVPTLTEVWEQCPDHRAMVSAGHALKAIGTPEARAVLRAGIDDHEYLAQCLASSPAGS
jgi:hypothetical protein